jgi:hypothetical protein
MKAVMLLYSFLDWRRRYLSKLGLNLKVLIPAFVFLRPRRRFIIDFASDRRPHFQASVREYIFRQTDVKENYL